MKWLWKFFSPKYKIFTLIFGKNKRRKLERVDTMVNGTLISFEGPEGVGNHRLFYTYLKKKEFFYYYNPWIRRCRHCRKDPPSHFRSRPYGVWMPRRSCCSILLVAGSICVNRVQASPCSWRLSWWPLYWIAGRLSRVWSRSECGRYWVGSINLWQMVLKPDLTLTFDLMSS